MSVCERNVLENKFKCTIKLFQGCIEIMGSLMVNTLVRFQYILPFYISFIMLENSDAAHETSANSTLPRTHIYTAHKHIIVARVQLSSLN